jgi:hypothetical protein
MKTITENELKAMVPVRTLLAGINFYQSIKSESSRNTQNPTPVSLFKNGMRYNGKQYDAVKLRIGATNQSLTINLNANQPIESLFILSTSGKVLPLKKHQTESSFMVCQQYLESRKKQETLLLFFQTTIDQETQINLKVNSSAYPFIQVERNHENNFQYQPA